MTAQTQKYIVMHGDLKLSSTESLTTGDVAELDPAWVKSIDPAGSQFVTLEQYDALRTRVEANDAAEAAISKARTELESDAAKLASARVHEKLTVAVRTIEAKKAAAKAPKAKEVPAPPTVAEQIAAKPKAAKAAKKGA